MAIKESSDELNPTVVVPQGAVPVAATPRKASDLFALAIATWGVGYVPLIPGTLGSLVGVGMFFLLTRVTTAGPLFALVLFSTLAITLAGIWAAFRTEALEKRKDPGKVVVDEVAGQMLALLPLTLVTFTPFTVIVSFTLFRFFDIVKPYPAGRFEALRGGFGVMCDDLVAGAYAAAITLIVISVF